MRRGGWFTLLGVAAAPCVVWALLRLGFFTPLFNFGLDRGLAGKTGLRVRVESLRWDVLHSIEADHLIVLAPVQGAQIPLLTLDHLRVDYSLRPVLSERMGWRDSLRFVRLDGLKLFLLRGPGGGWNLEDLRGLGPSASGATPRGAVPFAVLPAFRVELDDSEVILNDEPRDFHATIDRIQGNLDTRAPPRLAFALSGRTEGQRKKNLALAGVWDQEDGSVDGRLNLRGVALSRYLNYLLPVRGLRFTAGTASLGVRLLKKRGREMAASGRAELAQGALVLPGIKEPLSGVSGEVNFDPRSLRFKDARAHFLGSDWGASGAIEDLDRPRFDLTVSNPAVPLEALSQQVRGLDLLDLSGTASVTASLKGPAQAPRVDAFLDAPWMGIAGCEVESVSISAGLQGKRLTVRRLGGTLWGGEITGSAGMDLVRGGTLSADLSLNGALLQVARFRGRRLPFDGMAQAHVVVSGPWRSPNADFDLAVDRLRLGLWGLGNLKAHAVMTQKGLKGRFSSDLLDGTVAFSRGLSGSAQAFHDTGVTLKALDLGVTARGLASAGDRLGLPPSADAFLERLSQSLAAKLDAVLTVEGPLRSPTVWMSARLPQGKLYPGRRGADPKDAARAKGLDLRANGFVGFHQGDLLLGRRGEPLRVFLGPRKADLEVQALGRYPLGSDGVPGHMALALDLDLRLLDSTRLFKKSAGKLSGDLVVGGRLDAPQLQGGLSLTGFACEPAAYLAPVKAGAMKLMFRGQSVQWTQMSFKAPGLLSAAGGLDWSGGLDGLRGSVEMRTDAKGLRLQNWKSMGSGDLVLEPLDLRLDGKDQPLRVSGKILLSQAHVVYSGGQSGADASTAEAAPRLLPYPLRLDLRVGLGDNVLYEKLQTKTVDFSDPRKWFSDTLQSAEESLLQPSVSFRLAPTQQDFVVQGTVPDLDLRGELEVDRGRVTILTNDFSIGGDQGPAFVRFEGRHADVSGTAEARFNYSRNNPLSGRPFQKTVEVYARISPRSQEQMEAVGLEKQFLNYQVSFDSDPQIITDDPALQQTAVLNLVVLGDPLVDIGAVGSTGPIAGAAAEDPDAGALLASAGIGAVTSGIARKELNALLGNFKFMGSNWLDVVRLSPSIRYQIVGAAPIQAAGAAEAAPLASASSSSPYDIDWVMELGKYIVTKLYASFQVLTFGENSRDSVITADQSNETVQSYGVRAGVEYQVSSYRSFDVYGDFGCDDDLNPVAYNADQQAPYPSYLVQWRNTIPTDNYSVALGRQRRWEASRGVAP